MKNHKEIGAILNAGLLAEFIADAKRLSVDMGGFEFEKRVTSSHPVTRASQEADAAVEVFRIAAGRYFGSEFGSWQRELIGKHGVF